jgi:hypothetical protein
MGNIAQNIQQKLDFETENNKVLIEQTRREAKDRFEMEFVSISGSVSELYELAEIVRMMNDRWWRDPLTLAPRERNMGELLMLIVSELAEAMEGHRKNLNDTHLPQYKMFDVELVDTLIRLLDMMGQRQMTEDIHFGAIFADKMKYNFDRQDHSIEARNAEGGKKY